VPRRNPAAIGRNQKAARFYEGEIAQEIAAFCKANGGAMTVDDFAAQSHDGGGTISQSFDDVELLHEIPPNGQGASLR